jgi:uncharacterized protein (TIGR03437 family)
MQKLLYLIFSLSPVLSCAVEIPRYFEANAGQAPSPVRFLSRSADHAVFLTGSEAVLAGAAGSISLRFINSRADVEPAGIDAAPGRVNYLIGNDPRAWRTNIPTFRGVRYREIYSGIDVVFNGGEYDFLLAPGADPSRIEVEVRGATSVRIDHAGDLVLRLRGGSVRQPKPTAFQDGQRVPVSFVRRSARRFGFSLGQYDRTRPLMIDPVLLYSTYLGGSGSETRIRGLGSGSQVKTAGIAVDTQGNAYVTGFTESVDFMTINGFEPVWSGSTDAFVAKISPAGNSLVYATYLGGPDRLDRGFDIAVDEQGSAYVAGRTQSPRFPLRNPFQRELHGDEDGFVAKLDPSGGSLVWSTYFGGRNNDDCHSIAVWNGSVYVVGETQSPDLPLESWASNSFFGNPTDIFVARFTPDGSKLVFSTYLGGGGLDDVEDLAVDAEGNAYVVGYTEPATIPLVRVPPPGGPPDTLPRTLQPNPGGGVDAYLLRLSASGQQVQFATYLGGSGADSAFGVSVRSGRDVYVVGATSSGNFAVTDQALQRQNAGALDAWFARIDTETPRLIAATLLGGPGNDLATAVAVDATGRAWIAGVVSAGFPIRNAIQPSYGGGGSDAFLARVNASASDLEFATFLGGSGEDGGFGVAVDQTGNAYVTGATESQNFPVTPSALQSRFGGGRDDAFVLKVGDEAGPVVLSAATLTVRPLAPESYATFKASGLTGTTAVTVTDRTGTERSALISAALPSQVNFVLPAGTAPGLATVRVLQETREVARATIEIAPVSPGIFTANANGFGVPAAVVVRTDPAGVQSVIPVFTCGALSGSCSPAPLDISGPGTFDLLLFGTGIRGRSSLAGVQVRIGPNSFFPAQYAGAQPTFPGLDQVNVRLLRVLAGSGETDLEIVMDGQSSNRTRVAFQ